MPPYLSPTNHHCQYTYKAYHNCTTMEIQNIALYPNFLAIQKQAPNFLAALFINNSIP